MADAPVLVAPELHPIRLVPTCLCGLCGSILEWQRASIPPPDQEMLRFCCHNCGVVVAMPPDARAAHVIWRKD